MHLVLVALPLEQNWPMDCFVTLELHDAWMIDYLVMENVRHRHQSETFPPKVLGCLLAYVRLVLKSVY